MLIDGWVNLQLWYEDEGWLLGLFWDRSERWGVLTHEPVTSSAAERRVKRLLGLSKLNLKHNDGMWTGRVQVHHLELTEEQLPALEHDRVAEPQTPPLDQGAEAMPRTADPTTRSGSRSADTLDLGDFDTVVPGVRGRYGPGRGHLASNGYLTISQADAAAAQLGDAATVLVSRTTQQLVLGPESIADGGPTIRRGKSSPATLKLAVKSAFIQSGLTIKSGPVTVKRERARGHDVLLIDLNAKETK